MKTAVSYFVCVSTQDRVLVRIGRLSPDHKHVGRSYYTTRAADGVRLTRLARKHNAQVYVGNGFIAFCILMK